MYYWTLAGISATINPMFCRNTLWITSLLSVSCLEYLQEKNIKVGAAIKASNLKFNSVKKTKPKNFKSTSTGYYLQQTKIRP